MRSQQRIVGVLAVLCLTMSVGYRQITPWLRHTIDSSSTGADGVKLADINGDGLPDIVTGWEEGSRTRLYLHPGKAKVKAPWPAVTVGTTPSVEDAVFADLDGDGRLEILSCGEKTPKIYLSTGHLLKTCWTPHSGDRRYYPPRLIA